jgi:hypothetical protein
MNSKQDRPIICIAGLTALLLLLILTGDWIPIIPRSILYTVCMMGIFSILMLRNVLRENTTAIAYWRLYAIGLVILSVIFIAVVLIDGRFETGDALLMGMEPGTALMVFGLPLFPFWFTVLWVVGFRQAIMPQEREDHLNHIISDTSESEGSTDG